MHLRCLACEGSHTSTADKLEYYRLKNVCEHVLGDRVCPEQREQDREHAEEECLPVQRLLRSSRDRQTASVCSCHYAREVNEMDCFRCYYRP